MQLNANAATNTQQIDVTIDATNGTCHLIGRFPQALVDRIRELVTKTAGDALIGLPILCNEYNWSDDGGNT